MDQHKSFRETHNGIGFYGSFTFSPHHWPLAYSGTRSTLLYVALHDLIRHLRSTILSTLYLCVRLNYLLSTFVSILSSSSSLYSPSQWGAVDSLPPLKECSRARARSQARIPVCALRIERTEFSMERGVRLVSSTVPSHILAAILFKWTIYWMINSL